MFRRAFFAYDVILIGRSDRSELWSRLQNDTADMVSGHAHYSVLIVKQPGEQEPRPAGTEL